MKKEEVKLYSWVVRGKQRRKIIKVMDKPLMPSQIKRLTNLSLNNVSDILRLFVKKRIARCLNEKAKTGRFYVLTKKGKELKAKVQKNNLLISAFL